MILSVNSPPELDLALSDLIWSVVDTHPDSTHTLRLDRPFRELKDFALGLDMDAMDSMEHSHIPYVILLVRALEKFKAGANAEVTYDNMDAFKETLSTERRALDEENFEEAESQAFRVASKTEIPENIKALFASSQCENVSSSSRNFWLLVHALNQYTALPQSENLLPISASLPDMKASTTDYVHLQNLYKNKANEDLRAFEDCVKATLSSVGLDEDAIDDEEVTNFVKNCHSLQCIDGRSLRQEYETDVRKELIADELSNGIHMKYYLEFKACERFYTQNNRWPVSEDDTTSVTKTIIPPLLSEVAGVEDNELAESALKEM
ncbi:hypothetical protein QFC22_000385 [Naganishia vaughanmartiniae]|uniref:Uncharacterized protein n=1 Tax=Naganishia vaughanmartiniae TaxID=1424756 RepID=A0ACC2XMX9_9TREE|nr:hypothetical protein QFC22_000385 [Naganishia vaughanmartiniae]